jgi:hypothetical protein
MKLIPDGTVEIRGPYGGNYFYVERELLEADDEDVRVIMKFNLQ